MTLHNLTHQMLEQNSASGADLVQVQQVLMFDVTRCNYHEQ
jgi:hypothetical protein